MGLKGSMRTKLDLVQLKVIQKLPEAITELHEVPVHRILQLKQNNI